MPAASATVFRCGPVEVGAHTGEIADLYARTDALRPAGRPGRGNSIYTSPSLLGVTRWVHAATSMSRSVTPVTSQIKVDPANVWVYSIAAWERASAPFFVHTADLAAYWKTGIPLADWSRIATEQSLDPRQWEAIVPADAVLSTRPVSNRRLITSVPEDDYLRDQLMAALEHRRWFRGVRW